MLTLQHIAKAYRVGALPQPVLRDAELTLHAGEFTALVGPSGSGKSTLLNICGLIDRPDSGHIHWQGQDITHHNHAEWTQLRRNAIGFIFQGFNLIPVMTVWDNVAYPLWLTHIPQAEIDDAVAAVLQAVGLTDMARKRPDELSGGQRQRVAIARALVKRPNLIVADEPTASLDQDTALNVIQLLRELARSYGSAVVVATHDDRLLPFCDHLYRMDHGRILPVPSQTNHVQTPIEETA